MSPKPTIGAELLAQLEQLCEAAKLHATATRNHAAAALYLALESLRVQQEGNGSRVKVLVQPEVA